MRQLLLWLVRILVFGSATGRFANIYLRHREGSFQCGCFTYLVPATGLMGRACETIVDLGLECGPMLSCSSWYQIKSDLAKSG